MYNRYIPKDGGYICISEPEPPDRRSSGSTRESRPAPAPQQQRPPTPQTPAKPPLTGQPPSNPGSGLFSMLGRLFPSGRFDSGDLLLLLIRQRSAECSNIADCGIYRTHADHSVSQVKPDRS